MADGSPVESLSSYPHLQYVDNFAIFGPDRIGVQKRLDGVCRVLEGRGLPLHKQQVDEGTATVLGWEIDGPGRQVRPKKERVWRIRLAIRGLLRRGRVSSADMERLLGHMCFVSLIRRESLSVLDSCYKFVVKTRHVKREMPIWDSVANELRLWDGLAPLLWARFDAPACPTVVMVDASGWGLGAARASAPEALVTSVATTSERWRLRAAGCADLGGGSPVRSPKGA